MLTERYRTALEYAFRAHGHQTRKGGSVPYFSHLLGVSSLVLEYHGSEDQAIAGLLHDVIEDCGVAHVPIIRETFGEAVTQMVIDCTDSSEQPKPPWKTRKLNYIASLDDKADSSLLVSCCDKLHNARSIHRDFARLGDLFWERFNSDRRGIEWYYRSLAEKFLQRRIAPAVELEIVVESTFS